MPTLASLAAPQVVITTCGAAGGDKVGIMKILGFHSKCISKRIIYKSNIHDIRSYISVMHFHSWKCLLLHRHFRLVLIGHVTLVAITGTTLLVHILKWCHCNMPYYMCVLGRTVFMIFCQWSPWCFGWSHEAHLWSNNWFSRNNCALAWYLHFCSLSGSDERPVRFLQFFFYHCGIGPLRNSPFSQLFSPSGEQPGQRILARKSTINCRLHIAKFYKYCSCVNIALL